ncbi:MAG: mandelate racemase/muconate lactonizing enzyme family protein [Lacipirellulaceae bacterium]
MNSNQLSRRALLGAGAASPLLAALPGQAEATTPDRPLAKIADVEAFALDGAVFVKVTADDGASGWGEAGHSGESLVAQVVHRVLRPLILGGDVFSAEPLWSRMYFEADELGPGGIASQALAGVDCALWDLRGKLVGLPVWALLGGKFRDRVPLYGSFSRDKAPTPDKAAEKASDLVAEGFRAIKIRLAIREENQDPADDPARPFVAAVRRAIGDDVALYVDANNGYSPSRAIEVGRMLHDEFGVSVFEEPVAMHHYDSLAQVAEALPMAIAAGEHEYTRWQFRDLILHGKADILNPDVSKLAGLTEAKKVAVLAEVFDRPIVVHNARPTLLTAAHLHFVASCQTATRPQEHPGAGRLEHLWEFFENRLAPDPDGTIAVPDSPGLGLIVNEARIRAAAER